MALLSAVVEYNYFFHLVTGVSVRADALNATFAELSQGQYINGNQYPYAQGSKERVVPGAFVGNRGEFPLFPSVTRYNFLYQPGPVLRKTASLIVDGKVAYTTEGAGSSAVTTQTITLNYTIEVNGLNLTFFKTDQPVGAVDFFLACEIELNAEQPFSKVQEYVVARREILRSSDMESSEVTR
jgi:hypothetical protein